MQVLIYFHPKSKEIRINNRLFKDITSQYDNNTPKRNKFNILGRYYDELQQYFEYTHKGITNKYWSEYEFFKDYIDNFMIDDLEDHVNRIIRAKTKSFEKTLFKEYDEILQKFSSNYDFSYDYNRSGGRLPNIEDVVVNRLELRDILEQLVKLNLIEVNRESYKSGSYIITEKGKQFLDPDTYFKPEPEYNKSAKRISVLLQNRRSVNIHKCVKCLKPIESHFTVCWECKRAERE